MSDRLSVSVHQVSAKDRMVMRSLINLVNGRGAGPVWELLDEGSGDVTIIDIDSESGRSTWDDLSGRGGAAIALTSDKTFDTGSILHKPIRAREFLGLLDQLAGGRTLSPAPASESSKQSSASAPADVVAAEEVAPPTGAREEGFTLADHLRLQSWHGPLVLTEPGWPLLLLDPGSGAWFYDGSIADLDPVQFSRPMPESAGVALSSAELVERIRGHRQRPLSELKWYAGLGQMPGLLHPELRGDARFMLTQVPAEAMQSEPLHRLAQIVLRGPINLEALIAESGQPDAHVLAFLNACFASGKLLLDRDWRAAGF